MARFRILQQLWQDCFRRIQQPKFRPDPARWSDERITGACLGHSTVLLNFRGLWILTDPIFSDRAGPGIGPLVLGPKRYLHPALKISELPKIDLIVLSHAHFDHLDKNSLRKFDPKTQVVTARGTADLLTHFENVREVSWGETVELSLPRGKISLRAFAVKHWGARMMKDDWRGYNGWLMERAGRRICYAGDTAMTDAFRCLGVEAVDLMLMPIGAYDPWIRVHCNPEQAHEMALMAGAKTFVPMHHQTFKLSSEPMDEPARRIRAAFAGEPERLLAVNVGETFVVPDSLLIILRLDTGLSHSSSS